MQYNLRRRRPKRTDAELCIIHDALPQDVLRVIALYAHVMPKHSYDLRRRVKRASSLYADET
jgi:hypothetical protein